MAENDRPQLPFFLSERETQQMTGYWHSHRRVLIGGELNKDTLKKTTLELVKLDFMKTAPITLMIESDGGNVIPTQQLEDIFLMLNSPVDALVIGNCASMAVDLVQMCRRRMAMPSARILVHYIRHEQRWICDDPERLEADIRFFHERVRATAERRLELYVRRTGQSQEKIQELFRHGEVHSAYFSAKQALDFGLLDEIVTDFKLFPREVEPKNEEV